MEGRLAALLAQEAAAQAWSASPAEWRAWVASVPVLAADLVAMGFGDVDMVLELQLPLTSKRADVVLAGRDPGTGRPSYVVIELKQWGEAHAFEEDPHLVQVPHAPRPVAHPCLQVQDYCEYLTGFATALTEDQAQVHGVVYLHNATDLTIADLRELQPTSGAALFTGEQREALGAHLRELIVPDPEGAAADRLLSSPAAPNQRLLAVAAEEVQQREVFALLDEQRDAYLHVLHAVETARGTGRRTAVVVAGGPGSGKSVVALSLLGELARQGRTVMHATGSRSFTQSLRKTAGRRAPRVARLFTYFNGFTEAVEGGLDCLVLDEAHRIRETSVNRWTRREARGRARPQIDELLSAAKVPVFFLDQHQVVRPGEQGTVDGIERQARARGMDVVQIDLDGQFRCGGSQAYVDWVVSLLGLGGQRHRWAGDDAFDVQLVDSPQAMEERLADHRAQGSSARMTAGYCWRWSNPRPDGTLVPDIRIDGWARPWNLKSERSIGGAPAAALWATDPAGAGQVGCIYTAQGFEFDYAGVIIGPDLVLREDGWRSDRRASKDPDLQRQSVSDEHVDVLIRNVYKVLLTRGLRGVIIHSTDPETRRRLRDLV